MDLWCRMQPLYQLSHNAFPHHATLFLIVSKKTNKKSNTFYSVKLLEKNFN